MDVAKCDYPKDIELDGINLVKYFKNPSQIDERALFWRITNRKQEIAVRRGAYKYLRNKDGEFLYNLETDISENTDLKQSESQIVQELKLELEKFENEILDPTDFK